MIQVEHIKSYNLDIPDWNDIIENLNYSNENDYIKNTNPGFFVSFNAQRIEKVKGVMKDLECNTAHCYVNFLQSGGTYGNHKDTMIVKFWQGHGLTKWVIENKDEYILHPGDLITIPIGVHHNIIPLTPRFGISMANE